MNHGMAEINADVRAEALYLYDTRPDLVDATLSELPTDFPRDKAEELSRLIAMSSALAVAAGIPKEVSEKLFFNNEWHAQVEALLAIHAQHSPEAPK